jgi:AcrR family transcriptional regulator
LSLAGQGSNQRLSDQEGSCRASSPATEGLRERKKRNLRHKILQTALRLIEERGYEGTRLSDIAQEVEVGEATLYRYFCSKEDIVTEAVAGIMQLPLELADLSGERSVEEQLRCVLHRMAHEAASHRSLLAKAKGTPVGANLFGGVGPESARERSEFARALEDARGRGRVGAQIDAGILTEIFGAMLNAVVLAWAHRRLPDGLEPRIEAVIQVFLHGILSGEDPQRLGGSR